MTEKQYPTTAADIMTTDVTTVYPHQTLADALALLVPQVLQDPMGSSLQEIAMKRPLPEISVGMYCRADTPASAAWNEFRGYLLRGVRELARRS